MGPAGLTAVFGMGTGVAPRVWSPGSRPAGGFNPAGRDDSVGLVDTSTAYSDTLSPRPLWIGSMIGEALATSADRAAAIAPPLFGGAGSGWSSRSAVRTGRLRRSPALHSRPIDLVVFQEPMRDIPAGDLISREASRLDAFSAYPVPTWLPGGAVSRTAGTPEVGPPQSSRTRGEASQVSYAHGR